MLVMPVFLIAAMTLDATNSHAAASERVTTGAEVLASSGFGGLEGLTVGLVTNQTGRVGDKHLADLIHLVPNVKLGAILAPEHGFRGQVEAGEKVRDGIDPATGVPVHSLYGASRKPTAAMLRGLDILVFDIQDIGVRFYTYISTMGLAMQAAAEAGIPFMVLDRPNPLGGEYVAGFVLDSGLQSFVGQYPIPAVHGMTIGELAAMIKGEAWLAGLADLDLRIVEMAGWRRAMRWPDTGHDWVATSPNVPTFYSAVAYPGIGIIGESGLANEGRGTDAPFTVFGAPWLDAKALVLELGALGLPGVRFEAVRYTPRSIAGVAANPKFLGREIDGVRVVVADVATYQPMEVGVHAMAGLVRQARAGRVKPLFSELKMLHALAGTRRFHQMLMEGTSAEAVIAAWRAEVNAFRARAAHYLIYR